MRSVFICLYGLLLCVPALARVGDPFRPPAVPLVTMDPYISCWSFADNLFDQSTRHWTGRDHPMTGLLRVDRKVYRFMGPGQYEEYLPSGQDRPFECLYTTEEPPANWMSPAFNDKAWTPGVAPFGTWKYEDCSRTPWDTEQIWLRRTFKVDDLRQGKDLFVYLAQPGKRSVTLNNVEVYVNGILAARLARWDRTETLRLSEKAARSLRRDGNCLAVTGRALGEDRFIDVGLRLDRSLLVRQGPVRVDATNTYYQFSCGPVELDVTFTSPLLMDNLDLLSRPVSYLSFEVFASDDAGHHVQLYFDAGPQWCLNEPDQRIVWDHLQSSVLDVMQVGSAKQRVLARTGDDVRIDWGYLYVASPRRWDIRSCIGDRKDTLARFERTGSVKMPDDVGMPRPANYSPIALAVAMELGMVRRPVVRRHLMIGYDDLYSIEFFRQKLRPWWRRLENITMAKMLLLAENTYAEVMEASRRFDAELKEIATGAGGKHYAAVCSLAYRQAVAAHKLVAGPEGRALFFSKDNSSNGSIGAVDVAYPSAPLFLLYNPTLVKGMLEPIFVYCESGRWTKPFAPHDVGTYPQANGQTYPADMPVEASGSMLILCAAIAAAEGVPDYAEVHWVQLTQWAKYLKEKGFDPGEQLCTDDFAGPLAHNANLSVKAILALACYGRLAGQLGHDAVAAEYAALARSMAADWQNAAADGDHYSLTFDKKGTWSQKYNLVWDKVLDLNIFPESVSDKEIATSLRKRHKYGQPLDSRASYTKSDWIMWTAAMADSYDEFRQLSYSVYQFAHETPDRVPLSDWHNARDGKSEGFRARSVVGGYFMKLLADKLQSSR
ncbi:MAG: DUF4965 domain-containing protein [Planctomycetes bacterium]|nr:DUF4965 domain-containing protein [Planctomycetota bacterium]